MKSCYNLGLQCNIQRREQSSNSDCTPAIHKHGWIPSASPSITRCLLPPSDHHPDMQEKKQQLPNQWIERWGNWPQEAPGSGCK